MHSCDTGDRLRYKVPAPDITLALMPGGLPMSHDSIAGSGTNSRLIVFYPSESMQLIVPMPEESLSFPVKKPNSYQLLQPAFIAGCLEPKALPANGSFVSSWGSSINNTK